MALARLGQGWNTLDPQNTAPCPPLLQVAVVPALSGLLLTPLLLYKLFPPQIKDTPEAPKVCLRGGGA